MRRSIFTCAAILASLATLTSAVSLEANTEEWLWTATKGVHARRGTTPAEDKPCPPDPILGLVPRVWITADKRWRALNSEEPAPAPAKAAPAFTPSLTGIAEVDGY